MKITSNTKKILVVDDDPAIRNLIYRFFSHNDYEMEAAQDGHTARKLFKQFHPDLVILDVNLPDDSGFNLCHEISPTGVLVMMLTCLGDTNHILEGFEKGADDYLTKPFNLQILKARISALLKRQKYSINSESIQRLVYNNLVIDPDRRKATLDNKMIPFTGLEFDLLYFLARHPNRVWERSDLILAVWKDDFTGDERKVDVHIGQIRKKIGDCEASLIKTVWGKGYMFESVTMTDEG